MVFWLNSTLAVHFVLDPFPIKTFLNLLHSRQVQNSAISHDHDFLSSHVLEVHADLLGAARSETDTGRCHFECVLLLLRVIDWCRKCTSSLRNAQWVVVVAWVAVTWASWTMGAYCTQEIERSCRSGWCYTYGCHCHESESEGNVQKEESREVRHVLTDIMRGHADIAGISLLPMTRMNHYRVDTHLHTHGTGVSVVLE